MNYLLLSDFLWYFGHILSGMSIIFTQNYYYLAVTLVIFGQCITIISRPIGRLTEHKIQNKDNEDNEDIQDIQDNDKEVI
jgi:hypothetical protein